MAIKGLLCAHDAIAQKDYYPKLPEIPQEVDEDEETVKIVQLVKSNEPLVSPCFYYIFLIIYTIVAVRIEILFYVEQFSDIENFVVCKQSIKNKNLSFFDRNEVIVIKND